MKHLILGVLFGFFFRGPVSAQTEQVQLDFDFYGDTFTVSTLLPDTLWPEEGISAAAVQQYAAMLNTWDHRPLSNALLAFKISRQLDDWLFYQLIRKTVQQFSPKQNHYARYTVYKWFLLTRCGYNATLKTGDNRLLFYIQTNEEVFNLPVYYKNGRQYVCLNHHDYGFAELGNRFLGEIQLDNAGATHPFSYRVTHIPESSQESLLKKELVFTYREKENRFTILMNPNIQQMFANYPVVDYEMYFNIPVSRGTYQSLVPELKRRVARMNQRKGVDFIMRFTRYAFLFESDSAVYGRERRLSPEQTLLNPSSDCEDRAALFFFLVKEIYKLPMIVLSYPRHITIAVKLDKPVGQPVMYNGKAYTIAEPTPQGEDLALGKMLPSLQGVPYEVVYSYQP